MEFVQHLEDRLLFAVPKKGRLYEKCVEMLKGADIQFRRSNRLDIALCLNLPIALVFLPASDIPTFVGEGRCDMGITGHDQVLESGVSVDSLLDLGFGKCKLQVQVPEKSDYTEASQLAGKTIVSSFTNLTKEYFAKFDAPTTVKYVGGSVEASCALGVGDAIVDLVESGETMKAAGLHAIATVCETSARLIVSKKPQHRDMVDLIVNRFEGVLAAQKYVMCNYNAPREVLPALLKITPGRRAATVSPLEDDSWVAVSSMILKAETGAILDALKAAGASDILVLGISNCRV